MNRYDKGLIVLLVLVCALMYIPIIQQQISSQDREKQVVVQFKDDIVLEEPLSVDAIYNIEGTLGEVVVEVEDLRVRVEKETSPYHLCSIQGWISEINRPIICLPNDIIVKITAEESADDDVDTVIQ